MRRIKLFVPCVAALCFAFPSGVRAQDAPVTDLRKSDVKRDLPVLGDKSTARQPAIPSVSPGVQAGAGQNGASAGAQGGVIVAAPTVDDPAQLEAEIKASAEVDRRMLVALETEYGVRRATPVKQAPRSAGRQFEVDTFVEEEDEDWVRIRFTLSFWAAELDDAEITTRNDGVIGNFDPTDDAVGGFDVEGAAIYQFEIGFHPVISLVASYYQIDFNSSGPLGQNLVFEDRGFAAGTQIERQIQITSADAYLAIHALRGDVVRLDFMLGARYFKSEITYSSNEVEVRQAFEAVTPTLGLGLVVTPFECVELYGQVMAGGMEYGRSRKRNDDANRRIDERSIGVATFDAGVRINYQNNFGIAVGIRADSFEIERDRGDSGSQFEATVGGPYFSIFVGF